MKTFSPRTILQPIQCKPEQKKVCDSVRHEKETKHTHASASDLLHIKKGNLDWCKCGNCKNKLRETDIHPAFLFR